MEQLVTFLSVNADRPVVDLTGLEGDYIYSIQFVPDRLLTTAEAPMGVSIYKAVEDQLGLKLEATKLPLDYFTVHMSSLLLRIDLERRDIEPRLSKP
jgi:uncharacterized protein (TIGR03435 family)